MSDTALERGSVGDIPQWFDVPNYLYPCPATPITESVRTSILSELAPLQCVICGSQSEHTSDRALEPRKYDVLVRCFLR